MRRNLKLAAIALVSSLCAPVAAALELSGNAMQGGLMFGKTAPGSTVKLGDREVQVSAQGDFVIGFGRDQSGTLTLTVQAPDQPQQVRELTIAPRQYNIERVDGLPPSTVTPDPEVLERIRAEAGLVAAARTRRDDRADYAGGFIWPAQGRLSGFYGSQRILNGEPRNPHYGIDVAAPTGTPVVAPAPGIISFAHPDLYYSGGTIILDHGQGLSSTFLHLNEVSVKAGTRVAQGDLIGKIGATGRATGPHLDWRMNWQEQRVDPQPLVGPMPAQGE
jgi:murein DD-endopeptidase MepM/ murein hydrolase activator NlpD